MNLDKKIKEQLHNYKIQPTAKPWDRIEAELNTKQHPKQWFVYVRWAAAASIVFVLFTYPYWRKNDNNLVSTNSTVKHSIDSISKYGVKEQNNGFTNLEYPQLQGKNETNNSSKSNFNDEKALDYKSNINKIANINITKTANKLSSLPEKKPKPRFQETQIAFLKNDIQTFDIQYNIPENLNLPEFSAEMTESASSYVRWKKFFMEDLSEESDSTLTERALNLANKKSITFVKNNWKPTFAKWVKLKKGF